MKTTFYRKRIGNCLVKYNNIDFHERGFHKMMNKMHKCISEQQKKDALSKTKNSQYQDWYSELELLTEKYFKPKDLVLSSFILPKLKPYGEVM